MAKGLSPGESFIAVVVIVAAINWVAATYLEYPFAYCWLAPLLGPIYSAWGIVVLYIALIYGVFYMWRGNIEKAFSGALVMFVTINLPRLADVVFLPGGRCAG